MNDIRQIERPIPIPLTTITQLKAALARAKPGDVILLAAATFTVDKSLVVPKGVAIEGLGVMALDGQGRARALHGAPLLQADPLFDGDMLVLGDGARLSALAIEYAAGREGNLVVVCSTGIADRVSATIEDCLLINPNASGGLLRGPIGRALLVMTRNATGPGSGTGARAEATMRRTIVRATGGGSGVFAINFAPESRVTVWLERNVVGGGIDGVGGVSRPDTVSGSETLIRSETNIYRSDEGLTAKGKKVSGIGWSLSGGSLPPSPNLPAVSTDNNLLMLDSTGDRIVDVALGLRIVGGARPYDKTGPSAPGGAGVPIGTANQNRAIVKLANTTFNCDVSDVEIFGATSNHVGLPVAADFTPGDDNRVILMLAGVKGSGFRDNFYAESARYDRGPLPAAVTGKRNDWVIFGPIPFAPGPPTALIKVSGKSWPIPVSPKLPIDP